MRRLRSSEGIRRMVCENDLRPEQLILPVFLTDGNENEPVDSMPGVERLSIPALVEKSPAGEESANPDCLVCRAVRAVKAAVPEMLVFADIALDPYTTHGHDGILNATETDVDNDATLDALAQMALNNARAGADFVAPSDMMDGRIGRIRKVLDDNGFSRVGILAYSAKYASAFYGPFREAVGSRKKDAGNVTGLTKKTYQLSPANRREAIREALLDEAECADMLMVKPALPYLDILRDLRERSLLPLAAYQVSGEYSQIKAAAQLGFLDYKAVRDESLLAVRRAGADIILTYFAEEYARDFHNR